MNTRYKNLKFTLILSKIIAFFWMLRLTVEVKYFPLQFFVKSRLVEFSPTLIVSFLSLIKQVLYLHYRFTVSEFAQIDKVFI